MYGKRPKVKNVTDAQILRAARRTHWLNCAYSYLHSQNRTAENYDKHVQMTTLDRLVLRTKMPYKVCLRAVEKAVARGIVGYIANITRYFEAEK